MKGSATVYSLLLLLLAVGFALAEESDQQPADLPVAIQPVVNHAPFTPTGDLPGCTSETEPPQVAVTGPVPADPDGDRVSYVYRWYVASEETGYEFVPSPSHIGPQIPAADCRIRQIWRASVTALDQHGVSSAAPWVVTFRPVVGTCTPGSPAGWDYGDLESCYGTGTERTGGPANILVEHARAWLGTEITADALPNQVDLDGADDGVTFLELPWEPCGQGCVDVTVTTGPAYDQQPLFLYGWLDGFENCSFADVQCAGSAPEWIINAAPVNGLFANDSRTLRFCFTVPGVIYQGIHTAHLRFRLVSQDRPINEAERFVDEMLGETEDYSLLDQLLPVELRVFTATASNGSVTLNWTTASESNHDHFEIARDDVTIGAVPAVNSASGARYSWMDQSVSAGVTYTYSLIAVAINGHSQTLAQRTVTVSSAGRAVVTDDALYQNYPNPFNPLTDIAFDLKETERVSLRIYDMMGRAVATLVSGELPAGRHHATFDGAGLPSGLYVYRLETPSFSSMRKMMLLK